MTTESDGNVSDAPHVHIIGAGAVGGFYGAILKRAGCSVSVVLRSDYEAVTGGGFAVESPLGNLSYRPDHVDHADRVAKQNPDRAPDYVLLCVKVLPTTDRVALVRPWIGPHSCLVLIENGIDIESELAAAFPDNPLISCLALVAVSREGAGRIRHNAYGRLVMGAFPEGIDGYCRELAGLFETGGVTVKLTGSVVRDRWKKCVWNTALNPLAVLADGADTETMLDSPGGEQLARDLMMEVCAVAAADGHPLPVDRVIDGNIEATRNMRGFRNSMAQDYLNNRPIEIDAILGNVVEIARRHDVPVPRLETVLAALRMRGF